MASEIELNAVRGKLAGQIDEKLITIIDFPRPLPGVIEEFLTLEDLCSDVSDALDKLGIEGAVPGSVCRPVMSGRRVCGAAVTMRYGQIEGSISDRYARGERPRLADRDLYAVSQEGDVAVIQSDGGPYVSVMGGASAKAAREAGISACIVDGGVRDIGALRDEGLPVWSAGQTPTSGRHRLEAVEINGYVDLGGIRVNPGDLVCADDTGICFVPRDLIGRVLASCLEAQAAERAVQH